MVLSVSTTPPYKMSLHDVLRIYFFLMFIILSWAYKKPQKAALELLTQRRALQNAELQIYNFVFVGHSVTKCPGDGASCSYKMPLYKPFVMGSTPSKM